MSDVVGRGDPRGFVWLGCVCLGFAIGASCFLLAALQAAYSPFALQLPAAPFEQLETEALRLAFGSFLLALLWRGLVGSARATGPLGLLGIGALTKLGLLSFAASQGMMAIQASDPRALSPKLFTVRIVSNVAIALALAWVMLLAARRRRSEGALSSSDASAPSDA